MMSPYVGEIRMFSFSKVPVNWALCDGRLLQIAQYNALYNLLGTNFGGDGITTFAIPNLSGRVPMHQGRGGGRPLYVIGQIGGDETVTLNTTQIPAHTHPVYATTNAASSGTPGNTVMPGALTNTDTMYATDLTGATQLALQSSTVASAPASPNANLPHDNTMPTLTVSYCISLVGIYPSQS
ncbi:phage tail protein [Dyella psychrodurans]|uniref:Phage tail protein n=1 Tax=Dyella psychrodurans TaxID=1927960 RepID=A0A370WZL1_9GAMM|nr:tail fiber protein [Dyella psychrodurans]RDS81536.1 phage tail protein [Dyella psychrodurans]